MVLLWRSVELPQPGPVAPLVADRGRAGAAGTVVFALMRAAAWQNATRRVFDLPLVESSHPFTVAGVALAVFAAIWALLHGFGLIRRRFSATAERVLPRRLGQALGFGLALWVVWALADGVLGRRIFDAADASFEAADIFVAPTSRFPPIPARPAARDRCCAGTSWGGWAAGSSRPRRRKPRSRPSRDPGRGSRSGSTWAAAPPTRRASGPRSRWPS